MFTLTAFSHLVDGIAAMRRLRDEDRRRDIAHLPHEIRADIGYPDAATARTNIRGHRAPFHERW